VIGRHILITGARVTDRQSDNGALGKRRCTRRPERFVNDEAFNAKIRVTYALQRLAVPDDIARSILFLTSDNSSFVTGSALAVDGARSYH